MKSVHFLEKKFSMTKKKSSEFFRQLKGTFKDFFLKYIFKKFLPPNICDPNFCPPIFMPSLRPCWQAILKLLSLSVYCLFHVIYIQHNTIGLRLIFDISPFYLVGCMPIQTRIVRAYCKNLGINSLPRDFFTKW